MGSFTGQYQSTWTVAGNFSYLAAGGEFTTANGTAQQGLTRFAIRSAAPNRRGPQDVTAPAANSQVSGSPNAYNDGQWHHLAVSVGSGGATLYVDGSAVVSNGSLRDDNAFWGHWRVGGDSLTRWTPLPSSGYLNGSIANVAVYPKVLTGGVVANHFAAAGGTANPAPVANFTSSCQGLTCSFDGRSSTDDGTVTGYSWDFGDGASGTGATPSHSYTTAGNKAVVLTRTTTTERAAASATPPRRPHRPATYWPWTRSAERSAAGWAVPIPAVRGP